jgi:hypothetical protein
MWFLGCNLAAHTIEKGLKVVFVDSLYRDGLSFILDWHKNKE